MSPFNSFSGSLAKMQNTVCLCPHKCFLNGIPYGSFNIGNEHWEFFTDTLELHYDIYI